MNKKTYLKPEIEAIDIIQSQLLAGSKENSAYGSDSDAPKLVTEEPVLDTNEENDGL